MPAYPNLPWPITLHAIGLSLLGLYLTINPSQPTKPTSTLGIATLGLGLCYLLTSCVPIEENQMLYASAPARILLAAVAGLKVFVHGGRMGGDERRALLGIMVYDGLGGAALGAWLGTWTGRVPGY